MPSALAPLLEQLDDALDAADQDRGRAQHLLLCQPRLAAMSAAASRG